MLIIYIIFHLIPGDPIAATLQAMGAHHYDPIQYLYMANMLGFEYNPLLGVYILRFPIFLGNLLTAAWGHSVSVNRGVPVYDLVLANNTILHVILLCAIPLIIGTFYMIKKSRRKSIIFNSLVVTILIGAAFMLYVMFSVLFNIRGFGKLLVDAILLNDHFLIAGSLFFVLILFLLTTLTSNIFFSVYKLRSSKSPRGDIESNSSDKLNTGKKLENNI